jgi:hypothetical protein
MMHATIGKALAPAVSQSLEPGERVVWSQRARPYTLLSEAGLALVGRLVPPVIILLIAWELLTPEERGSLVTSVAAIPRGLAMGEPLMLLLAVAILMVLLRILLAMLAILGSLAAGLVRLASTAYAVTDRRVLIVEGARVTSLAHLPMLRVDRRPLGHDIVFADRRHALGGRVGFFGLVDATEVERHLLPFLATSDRG